MVVLFSSNINELFYEKIPRAQKAQKRKRTKAKKTFLNALKKHLRGRKSPIRLFAFLCFLFA